jgi:hypothetical protein
MPTRKYLPYTGHCQYKGCIEDVPRPYAYCKSHYKVAYEQAERDEQAVKLASPIATQANVTDLWIRLGDVMKELRDIKEMIQTHHTTPTADATD